MSAYLCIPNSNRLVFQFLSLSLSSYLYLCILFVFYPGTHALLHAGLLVRDGPRHLVVQTV